MNFESGSCTDSVSGDVCVEVDAGADADCDGTSFDACPLSGDLSGYVVGGTTPRDPGPGSSDLIVDDADLAISTPVTLHWLMRWDDITSSAGAKDQGGLWQDDDSFACVLQADNDAGDFTVYAKCDSTTGSGCVLTTDPFDSSLTTSNEAPYWVRLYYDTAADDCTIEIEDCEVTCNGSASGVLVDGWAMGADRTESDVAFDNIGLCAGVVQDGVKCGD
jgi:hypothetical protein